MAEQSSILAQAAERAAADPFYLAAAFAELGPRSSLMLEARLFPRPDRAAACVLCLQAIRPDEYINSPAGNMPMGGGYVMRKLPERVVVCESCCEFDTVAVQRLDGAERAAAERLAPIALCRRPATHREAQQIAARFGCDAERLIDVVRSAGFDVAES